jgi:tetratricopeptide (TPR) repeat protein
MAKKHRQNAIRARKRAQQQRHRPGQRVQGAAVALRSGDAEGALALATGALAAANDPSTSAAARSLVIEAHFRAAAAARDPRTRLHHLDAALQRAPDETRLRYHRAITLWELGRIPEALPELKWLEAQPVCRPGVAFLSQLACAATGQPWSDQALSVAAAHTIQILQAAVQETPTTALRKQTEPVARLGDHLELWHTLLHMQDKPKAAPAARLQTLAQGMGPAGGSAVVPYYLGVVALRAGDVQTAQSAWRRAAEAGMATPWFVENRLHLLCAQAHALGQEGHWDELIGLLQAHRVTETPDPVLSEMLAVAHAHLGDTAAHANDWSTAAHHWQAAATRSGRRQLFQNLALAEEALGHWRSAAEAWREMVRRRPRKPDHPDALTDAQTAALWRHIAECYEHGEEITEVLTCLKNAAKYAPEDLEVRVQIADVSKQVGRDEAAEHELERILALNAEYVPALVRLGALYEERGDRDAMSIWRRVLALEPQHPEAREALAQVYVKKVQEESPRYGWFDRVRRRSEKEKVALLQEGLRELPGHPVLLLELGELYRAMRKLQDACTYFTQAWEAAPQQASIVAAAIHSLLHAGGGDIVTRLLPTAREMPGLLAMFWVDVGRSALHCQLGQAWTDRFWAEALALAAQGRQSDTVAYALVQICEAANSEQAPDVAARYEARLRTEHPRSGGVEFIEAYHAASGRRDMSKALRLLRQAQHIARQAHEHGIAELAGQIAAVLQAPPRGLLDLLTPAGGRHGRRLLDKVLEELEEEDWHAF